MRIAFVNATKKWGGVKTWCLDMSSALRQQGHETYIFGRAGDFITKAEGLGIPARAVSFGFDFNPLLIAYFLYFFTTRRIDVVVVNVAKDLRTAGVAARLLGVQVVQHVGSGGDFEDIPLVRLVQRLVRPRLTCCSEYVRRRIVLHVPSMRGWESHALHPGIVVPNAPEFLAHTPPVIVATSQLNADKHHTDLLLALARLKNEGLDFRAVIAGTGSLKTGLKIQARELGLDDRVEWTGFTPEVRAVLRRGDIFVLPTLIEPLGIALEEAMAEGLAPVARNAGGVPEIWPPACREFLVGPDLAPDEKPTPGPEGLTNALRRLLTMPQSGLLALRRAAWEHARDHFALPQQAARFAEWLASPPKIQAK